MIQRAALFLILLSILGGTQTAWAIVPTNLFAKFSVRGKAHQLMSQSLETQIRKLEKFEIKVEKCIFTTAQNQSLIDSEELTPCLETKLNHDFKATEKGRLDFLVSYKGIQKWATLDWKQDSIGEQKGLKKALFIGGGHLFSLAKVLDHEAELTFHSPLPVNLNYEGLTIPVLVEKMDLVSGREDDLFKTTIGIQSQNILAKVEIYTNISIPFLANNYLSEKKFTSLVLDTIPLKPTFRITMEQRKHD